MMDSKKATEYFHNEMCATDHGDGEGKADHHEDHHASKHDQEHSHTPHHEDSGYEE